MSEEDDPGRARRLVAAALLLACVLAAGLWLTGALRQNARLQDCVAQGRSNCAPVGQ